MPGADDPLPFGLGWALSGFGTNRNVQLCVVYVLLIFLSNGLLLSGTMSLYIDVLTHSVTTVGYTQGVFGALALAPGFVGGYFADRHRRDTVVRLGGAGCFVGTFPLCVLCLVFLLSEPARDFLAPGADDAASASGSGSGSALSDDGTAWEGNASSGGSGGGASGGIPGVGSWMFVFVVSCVGVILMSESLSDAGYLALQADSLETGKRTRFLAKKQLYRNIAIGLGPLVFTTVFLLKGDEWTVDNMTYVILCGALVRLPAVWVMFQFRDDYCLREASLSITETRAAAQRQGKQAPGGEQDGTYVPHLMTAFRMVSGLGSGMTVKFFPLFFKADDGGLDLSPSFVYLILASLPFVRAFATKLSGVLVHRVGRIPLLLSQWLCGIACLAAVVVLSHCGLDFHAKGVKAVVLLLYLGRCSLLQSGGYMITSVMNDYTPKGQRARWASFSQLQQAGWSGSAVVGGLLVHHHGYTTAFLITTVVHLCSLAFVVPLLCIVKDTVKGPQAQHTTDKDAEVPAGVEGGAEEGCLESDTEDEEAALIAPAGIQRVN